MIFYFKCFIPSPAGVGSKWVRRLWGDVEDEDKDDDDNDCTWLIKNRCIEKFEICLFNFNYFIIVNYLNSLNRFNYVADGGLLNLINLDPQRSVKWTQGNNCVHLGYAYYKISKAVPHPFIWILSQLFQIK